MKQTTFILLCAALLFGCNRQPLVEKVKSLNTSSVNQAKLTVYYSKNHDAKARQALQTWARCLAYFKSKFNLEIGEINLALLDENDFGKLSLNFPYGFPIVRGTPPVAFLPATTEGVVATETKSLLKKLDSASIGQMAAQGFDQNTAVDKSVELIGFHELGHLLSEKMNIQTKLTDDELLWLKEWTATYFAYCYLYANDLPSAKLWLLTSQGVLNAWTPATVELEAMHQFRKDAKVYGWYQAKLIVMAADIYAKHGEQLLEILAKEEEQVKMAEQFAKLAAAQQP